MNSRPSPQGAEENSAERFKEWFSRIMIGPPGSGSRFMTNVTVGGVALTPTFFIFATLFRHNKVAAWIVVVPLVVLTGAFAFRFVDWSYSRLSNKGPDSAPRR